MSNHDPYSDSSEPFGWFAPPKSTRAWVPTLFMESFHSLSRVKRFQALRAPSVFCLTGLVVLWQRFEVDEYSLRRFCTTYLRPKPLFKTERLSQR